MYHPGWYENELERNHFFVYLFYFLQTAHLDSCVFFCPRGRKILLVVIIDKMGELCFCWKSTSDISLIKEEIVVFPPQPVAVRAAGSVGGSVESSCCVSSFAEEESRVRAEKQSAASILPHSTCGSADRPSAPDSETVNAL